MKSPAPSVGFYITGGTLPRDAPSYVIRKADTDLFDGLLEGQFCYVLTSRQMGKSSLMVRTAARLRQEGVTCAVLDLTAIGQDLTREQWYDGLQNALGRQLHLEDELEAFWLSHGRLSPLQRWMLALEQIVLTRIKGNVILFIDEIDAVRSLPFSADEFLAAIRELYNRRSENPLHARLTFCLLGVASPSDLIRDTRTTPFNIGHRIDLTDFLFEEAAPLAEGLRLAENSKLGGAHSPTLPPVYASTRLLTRVLHWTGGHPYLTQRLCHAVADLIRRSSVKYADVGSACDRMVDHACSELLVSAQARVQNDNLLFVRDRLLRSEADVSSLLELYRRIQAGRIVRDDEADPLITILRLSGITRSSGGRLYVRNRIYSRVFDHVWITANMPDAEVRRHRAAFRRGVLRASVLSGIVVLALAGLGITAMRQASDARHANSLSHRYAVQMESERKHADAARLEALQEARRARQAESRIAGALRKAEERRKEAEHQKRIAGARSAEAESARRETSKELRDSYLAQAQASRWSGRVGQKYNSLAALEKAARFPASPEFRMRLRNEAIACMALPIDLRVASRRRVGASNVPDWAIDDGGALYVRGDPKGDLSVRRVIDGREVSRIPSAGVPIDAVRFAPGARHLMTVRGAGRSMRIDVWDLRTRSLSWRLPARPQVNGLRFSEDGSALFVCFSDRSIRRIDLASRVETTIGTFEPTQIGAWFSADGRLLAYIGRTPRTIRMLDLATHRESEVEVQSDVSAVAWSKDGAFLAAGTLDRIINVWDVADRQLISQMRGHLSAPRSMEFLRGGRLLATAGWEGSLRFWEVQTGRQLLTVPATVHYQFSADERRLYLVGAGVLQQFDVDAGLECRTFPHRDANGFSADFLRGTSLMITAAQDGVRFWDLDAGSQKAFLPTGSLSHALLPANGSSLVAYGVRSGRLSVRPIRFDSSGNSVWVGPLSASRIYEELAPVRCSGDGRRLICGHGSSLSVFGLPGLGGEKLLQPSPQVSMASLSPDGSWAASGAFHVVGVKVWDARTSRCVAILPTGESANPVFSPNAKWLVTGGRTTYQFWRVGSWRKSREIARDPDHGGLAGAIAFTKDGRQAALAHTLSVFHLIDPDSGAEYAQLETPEEQLVTTAAMFSPDGAYFASGTESGIFYLWDLRRIRSRLARMGLDWDAPQPAAPIYHAHPLRVVIEGAGIETHLPGNVNLPHIRR